MARRGSGAGGVGGLVLLIPVGIYFAGYYSVGCGAAILALLVCLAGLVYYATARIPPDRPGLLAASGRHPILWTLVLLVPMAITARGMSDGDAQRQREARERAEASRLDAEYRQAEAARAVARQRAEAEEVRQRAEAAAIEARRTPAERAALIVALLERPDADAGPHPAVCVARAQAEKIPREARRDPEVRRALDLLRRRAQAQLAVERRAFAEVRMVRCCDGNTSPTCACRRGSYGGCCSRHGGVCGCEPLPDEIYCEPSR